MISIIVPVYNTEKYIVSCINSIKNQTFNDYEVIIVNDGTEDNSISIIQNMIKDDKRFRILNKENGGLSSARNYGIENSSGEWITFIDSDDYIAENYLKTSINAAYKYNADVVIMKMCNVSENTSEAITTNDKRVILEFDAEKAIEESLYQKRYSCCAPAKLYKRKTIADIRFPIGKLSEDLAVCHKILNNSSKIVYISEYGYYYRQHDNSIMHTFNINRLDALQWADEIEKFCNEKYPKIEKAAKCRTFNIAIHFLLEIPLDDPIRDKCINQILAEIKRTRISVIFNLKARYRERISAILSFFGEKTLKNIWQNKIALKQKEY